MGMDPASWALIIGGISAAVGAGSAVSQHQDAIKQNNMASDAVAAQEQQQQQADKQLQQQQAQNQAKQMQDAQWMAMKTQANKMAGLATMAPGSLASQSGSLLGAGAGATAGKTLLGK